MADKVQKIREEVERIKTNANKRGAISKHSTMVVCNEILSLIDSLQEEPVSDDWLDMSKIDCKIQYANIESGIHAHAEDYSFNIESQLFNQLTKEQQELWRKEIEQAIISGGHCGVELARDKRYKENQELVSVYLEEAAIDYATKEAAKDISGDWTTDDILNAFKAGANAVIEEITACLPKTNCANPNEVLDIIVAKIKELKGK